MTLQTTSALTEAAARDLTDRIKRTAENLWELVAEAHEGKAWKALGYTTWKAYVAAEFEMSKAWSYRLLNQAQVTSSIQESTDVDFRVTESQAGRMKPHLAEVQAEIREGIDEGGDPVAVVSAVLQKYGAPTPKAADAIARETGTMVVASDGFYHNGSTEEERAETEAQMVRHGALYDALETLGAITTPEEVVDAIPDYQAFRVSANLNEAQGWLNQFAQAWRAKHGDSRLRELP